ncbi:N-6 DNA methylase [Methanotrichaceae archaeon Mx]|uniref:site-specific DNA-methyltransferase (adenine-specific) n=1 Tax=Candidatus Methanocrinis natronophilus TaxID=3033396 RepID=A0ABT5X6G8_9EURY|nr:N-6 DNA methylase [Candidatus Methanocrinis natronophilus]MDF0590288.1 N-6 DNA methylase [Candidatus Methanocrinis natronophilus]
MNFSVQRTIDRIVFLRICEDRGIERYGWLQSLLEGARVYPRLCEFFRRADERYNAGLFHFGKDPDRLEPPDELTLSLEIDDKPLKEIIKSIYYPESPYEFSVLPPEILGQVYEQFLGKVISVSPGRRVKVDYKPEVRKAGGVYYTPSYIVEYIVDNTVGKLLEGQTPTTAAELKVLDPACGSGSFLIGAYQKLLDWHRDWYVEKLVPLLEEGKTPASKEVLSLLPAGYTAPNKRRGKKKEANRDQQPDFPIFEARGGEWKLTTRERRRILLNNIYGVDIDSQAVEVTKLSLHLKVLEGENEETLSKQLKLFQERALPYLGRNIKCGNSLIGPDFYDGQTSLLADEDIYRVNAFDWEGEFPEILGRGGFDAVIGNPPYGIVFEDCTKHYLEEHYPTFRRNNDYYVAFTQRSLELMRLKGIFGFIIPNTFLIGPYFDNFKIYILHNTKILQIVDFGIDQVFKDPNVFTGLLFLKKTMNPLLDSEKTRYIKVSDIKTFPEKVDCQYVDRTLLESLRWSPENSIMSKMLDAGTKLDNIAWVKDVGLNYCRHFAGRLWKI